MASILRRLRADSTERGTHPGISLQDYFNYFGFNGNQYAIGGSSPNFPSGGFVSYVHTVHEQNGVVAAAVTARALLISQLRFVWRNTNASATPGRTYGASTLAPLERPGSITRPELLHRAEVDVSYSGNAYIARRRGQLFRLRPDFVQVVLGSNSDPTWDGDTMLPPWDAEEIGILYQPQHNGRKGPTDYFARGEYAHWMPEPDPVEFWRGESWVTSVMREIATDGQVTDHQSKFFDNAATPSLVFMMDPSKTPEQVRSFADMINDHHSGTRNRWKNLFLGGGTDVKVVGSDLNALNLRDVQGGFESRIASRARVPAVVLGIREGMQGSALNAGNYSQTRRLWADGWFTPTVQNLCAALEGVIPPPADSELWYDPADVMFLQEDMKDAADIAQTRSQAIRAMVESGYKPDAAAEAVITGDFSKLIGQHTGTFSVQLQPPGNGDSNDDPERSWTFDLDENGLPVGLREAQGR